MQKNSYLKIVIFIAVLMVSARLIQFVISRIPPYDEGQCLSLDGTIPFKVKILKNHVLRGYSDVEVKTFSFRAFEKGGFNELKALDFEKEKCDE